MLLQLLLLLCLALIARTWLKNFKYRDFDGPSPFLSLPMLGHGYLLGNKPQQRLMEMKEKYGDVFRFDVGDHPTIIFCKYDLVKATCFKESYSGRVWSDVPAFTFGQPVDAEGKPILGITASEGAFCYEQKKFMLKCLSDLGMGKLDTMEAVIEQEAQQLAEIVKAKEGRPTNSRNLFITAVNNVIWRIATGKRTRQDDPELQDLTNRVVQIFISLDPTNFFRLLQTNSTLLLRILNFFGLPNSYKYSKRLRDLVEKVVDQSLPDENGNYIERGLDLVEKDHLGGKKTIWTSPDAKIYLKNQLLELFVAGTDTSSTSIEWVISYLVKFPLKQEQMHREIELITMDNSRPISLADRSRAHYCNAFIDEVWRHSNMNFFPPTRKTRQDEVLQGKRIPKGTQIALFLYAINRDPSHYSEPDEFKPERFLDENGTFCKDETLIPFGIGKRRCPGEVLSRAEVFLFITRLVQQFKLTAADINNFSLEALPGLVFYPKPFNIMVKERPGTTPK